MRTLQTAAKLVVGAVIVVQCALPQSAKEEVASSATTIPCKTLYETFQNFTKFRNGLAMLEKKIQERGTSCEVTPDVRRRLRRLGYTPELIETIEESYKSPAPEVEPQPVVTLPRAKHFSKAAPAAPPPEAPPSKAH